MIGQLSIANNFSVCLSTQQLDRTHEPWSTDTHDIHTHRNTSSFYSLCIFGTRLITILSFANEYEWMVQKGVWETVTWWFQQKQQQTRTTKTTTAAVAYNQTHWKFCAQIELKSYQMNTIPTSHFTTIIINMLYTFIYASENFSLTYITFYFVLLLLHSSSFVWFFTSLVGASFFMLSTSKSLQYKRE